jgi:hypothetical protein
MNKKENFPDHPLNKSSAQQPTSITKSSGGASRLLHKQTKFDNIAFGDIHVFLIDFGLSFISSRIEDKAVDLHVLKQAIEAKQATPLTVGGGGGFAHVVVG